MRPIQYHPFLQYELLTSVSFEQAIIIGRFYSALLSVLLIPSVYYIGKKLFNEQTGLIAALFSLLSVGCIQFAHFSTFEMWLTFVGLWYFYCCYQVAQTYRRSWSFGAGILFGILLAIKISSIILLPLLGFAIVYGAMTKQYHGKIRGLFLHAFLASLCAISIFCLTCPFVFLDFPSFRGSMSYESSVAFGTLPVFYTGGFFKTIPIAFQFQYVYPFLLNPLLTLLFFPAFVFVAWHGFKHKHIPSLLLITCYLFLFVSQAFLFAKWTRYMVPTLPFVDLILAFSLQKIQPQHTKRDITFSYTSILVLVLGLSFLFCFAFFKTVYLSPDTRLEALDFSKKNIPSSTSIVSEVYDLGITPFNSSFPTITLFNFYDMDTGNQSYQAGLTSLDQASYFILPSQRIMRNRLSNSKQFPTGYKLYRQLFDRKLGYQKIYETPCDIWCTITYMGDPIFHVEDTVNVFDRPTVFIFEKK